MSLAHADAESPEKFHKESAVFKRYSSQRGLLKTKYAMDQLLLVTSTQYAN